MKNTVYIFLVLFITSCLKIDEASEIPLLKFNSYELSKGLDKLGNEVYNIVITAEFEDGDGDIGYANQTDTTQSLFLNTYKIENGKHVDSTMEIGYRIPYVEPVKSIRVVKGEIELTHELKNTVYSDNDSVYFEMYMFDRAMNKSNIVKTPEILLTEE